MNVRTAKCEQETHVWCRCMFKRNETKNVYKQNILNKKEKQKKDEKILLDLKTDQQWTKKKHLNTDTEQWQRRK